ncbi:MAG: ribonuclease P protein component [Parcubacteria group bacterium Athens1014_10]|nr:MAG: ribonuclease P protein component [Parcubacteria group bacterium Athens1014_10]
MLKKQYRLTKTKDFEKIWQKGRSFFIKEIGIKFLANNLDCSRFGIIVPNKVIRKAVLRNKIKRRLRNMIKKRMPLIKEGVDCVFLARPGIGELTFQELEERVDFILKNSRLLK